MGGRHATEGQILNGGATGPQLWATYEFHGRGQILLKLDMMNLFNENVGWLLSYKRHDRLCCGSSKEDLHPTQKVNAGHI